ncbi:MAG: sigma-70 family RNA polymerase sigma factor [Planctomycetes bacterium]|nr:sigma-70 family RNA polymerase sigma factor [Planctomycetota bacterium]
MNRSGLPWEHTGSMDVNGNPSDLEWFVAQDARLRALARRLVRDAHLAEDVAQDAWTASMRGAPQRASLGAWLAGVTRKLSLKALRSNERRLRRELGSATPETPPSTDALVAREAARRAVADAVLALPDATRTVIVWRFFDGLSPGAIARRLGEPVETVRTRIKRGLDRLRQSLDSKHGGNGHASCVALAPLAFAKTSSAGIGAILTGVAAMNTSVKVGIGVAALVAVTWTFVPWFESEAPLPIELVERSSAAAPMVDDDRDAAPTSRVAAVPATTVDASTPLPTDDTVSAQEASRVDVTLRARWASDGTPAAGIGIHFVGDLAGARSSIPTAYETRSDGSIVVPNVKFGMAVYEFDRGSGSTLEVDATHHEFDVVVPNGLRVSGRVVDSAGQPVADAAIRAQGLGMNPAGFTLARSGQDGTFVIRDLSQQRPLGAVKVGYSPSPFVFVQGAASGERSLTLTLRPGGADVDVVVLSPEGRPVAGAIVVLQPPGNAMVQLEDGSLALDAATTAATTDRTGRARFIGVRDGDHGVTIALPPFAEHVEHWTLTLGNNAERVVTLDHGVRVFGRVADRSGKPATGAYVERKASTWFSGGGVYADDDGRYEMTGVPRTPQTLRANLMPMGSQEIDVTPAEGEHERRVDFTLSSAANWIGSVVDDQGAPLVGWIVRPMPAPPVADFNGGQAYTGDDGRFMIVETQAVPQRLEVLPHDAPTNLPTFAHGPIEPSGEAVTIVVPTAKLARMQVVGQVVDANGRAVVGIEVYAHRAEADGGGFAWSRADEAGAFRVGPLTPGTFTLTIRAPGLAPFVAAHTFGTTAETWDLGDVALAAGGQILAHVERLPDETGNPWISVLRESDGGLVGTYAGASDGIVRSDLLPSGRYRVCVGSWDRAWSTRVVEVTVNTVTEITCPARKGTRATLRVTVPSGTKRVELFVETGSGTRIAAGEAFTDPRTGIASQVFALEPGSYRAVARGPSGNEVSTTLIVGTAPIDVQLTLH